MYAGIFQIIHTGIFVDLVFKVRNQWHYRNVYYRVISHSILVSWKPLDTKTWPTIKATTTTTLNATSHTICLWFFFPNCSHWFHSLAFLDSKFAYIVKRQIKHIVWLANDSTSPQHGTLVMMLTWTSSLFTLKFYMISLSLCCFPFLNSK